MRDYDDNDDRNDDYVRPENRGLARRNRDYVDTLRRTGDRRAAVRAYCAGNKWLTENAKAVGNW